MLDVAINIVGAIDNIVKGLDDMGIALPVVIGLITGLKNGLKFNANGGFENLINQQRRLNAETTNTTNALNRQAGAVSRTSGARITGGTNPGFIATIKEGWKSLGIVKFGESLSESFKKARQSSGVFASGLTAVKSALTGVEAKALGTKVALGAMNLAMSAVNMGIGILISLGVSKVIQHFTDEANKLNDALEKNAENITTLNNKINTSTKARTNLSDIRDEYKKLYNTVDKTSEQQERFKELQQQIIDICGEDIVLAYDKNNNPILSMGGDVDKLIAKYDKLIKKQQEALNQEYKDQQRNATDKMNEGQGFAGKDGAFNKQAIKEYNRQIENIRKKKTELNNTFTQTGDSAWLEDYSERLAKLSDTYASAKEAVVDAEAKISAESQKINKSIVNSLSIGDGFSKLKSDVQSEMIEVINGLDFSQLTSGQQSLFESNMKKMFDSGTIDESIRKLYDLKQAYEDTSDITAYEQGIEKLIPSLAKLWGVNEDVARSMVELPESAKMAQNAMDAYLRSFGKNINMTDKETKDLMATWDAYNNFLEDLGGLETVEKDGKMVYNIKEVKATLEDSNLPDKVKDLVNRLMSDNEFSLDDMELTAKLSQIYVEDDEDTRNQLIQDVQNLVDKQFGKGKIDVGKLFVTGEYAVSDDDKKKIDDAFASFKQFDGKDEIVKTLRAQVENTDQVENYAKLMDNLRGKDKDIETFFKNNIQDLSELESYEDMIQWVFDHPEAVTKCHINVLGEDTIKTAKAEIDNLLNEKDEKDIKVKIDKALAQGDIATVMDLIGQLPAEKQIEVGVALSNALDELGTVDAIQLKNKVVDVTVMAFQALQQLYALQGLKIPEKYIKIISNSADVASKLASLKQQIKEIPRSISIMATLTYTEKGKSKVPHSGKGKSVMWGDSIGEFSNIEDNPYSVEQLSATPMVTSQPVVTANDVNTATPTSDSSGGISAYATRDFNSIGDIETALTPISLEYQNVLDMIEYSVELFKELQYRIETVTKKTSLLDKQMEKAVGTEKIKYLKQKNKLLEEQAKLQKEYYDDLISERETLQQKLQKEGFKFNEDGNMTNYEEKLLAMQKEYKRLQDVADKSSKSSSSSGSSNNTASDKASKYKEELDKLTNLANKYYDIQQSDLFSCEEQWQEMKNTIKENNDEIEKLTREDKLYKFSNAITQLKINLIY